MKIDFLCKIQYNINRLSAKCLYLVNLAFTVTPVNSVKIFGGKKNGKYGYPETDRRVEKTQSQHRCLLQGRQIPRNHHRRVF